MMVGSYITYIEIDTLFAIQDQRLQILYTNSPARIYDNHFQAHLSNSRGYDSNMPRPLVHWAMLCQELAHYIVKLQRKLDSIEGKGVDFDARFSRGISFCMSSQKHICRLTRYIQKLSDPHFTAVDCGLMKSYRSAHICTMKCVNKLHLPYTALSNTNQKWCDCRCECIHQPQDFYGKCCICCLTCARQILVIPYGRSRCK